MILQFRYVLRPSASLVEHLAACDPANPLQTSEYANAHESLGARPCLLGLYSGNELVSGCMGFLSGSFLRRNLHIRSLPNMPDPATFWQGVLELCRRLGVWRLQIDTCASPEAIIPQLPGELERRVRWEYVLDLGYETSWTASVASIGEILVARVRLDYRFVGLARHPHVENTWNSWMLRRNDASIVARK